ncbi:MAG: hypothetical protein AAF211_21930 [Myxococcota bacterium]
MSVLGLVFGCTSWFSGPEPVVPPPPTSTFATLEPGVELATFTGAPASSVGDSRITVLRLDPATVEVALLAVSELGGRARRPQQWLAEHDLLAATNVALFEPDYRTATFHMRRGDHVNHAAMADDANHFLLLDPVRDEEPPLRIVDRTCEEVPLDDYRTVVQGYRITDCEGGPAFADRDRIWSHASLGVDRQGRMLWIFARSPWSTHDFAQVLAALPLDLHRVQYAEGGPPAMLVVNAGDTDQQWLGSYETGAFANDDNQEPFPLPFVLGARRKAPE